MSWTYIVISGASRGFGRACAIAFSNSTRENLHFILLGRDSAELQLTKSVLKVDHTVDLIISDLAEIDKLTAISDDIFAKPFQFYPERSYEKVIFLNNSGSLGSLQNISKGVEALELSQVINLNVTSSCFLTAEVARR